MASTGRGMEVMPAPFVMTIAEYRKFLHPQGMAEPAGPSISSGHREDDETHHTTAPTVPSLKDPPPQRQGQALEL